MYEHFEWEPLIVYVRILEEIPLGMEAFLTLNRHDISSVIIRSHTQPVWLSLDLALLSANLNGQANGPLAFPPTASDGCAIRVLASSHSVYMVSNLSSRCHTFLCMHTLNPFHWWLFSVAFYLFLFFLNPAIIKMQKPARDFYMQRTTYTPRESKDIWIRTNFAVSNVNCQATKIT